MLSGMEPKGQISPDWRASLQPSSKEPSCQYRRGRKRGFDPWFGKIPQRRAWQPTQYSRLENPMDRGAWQATVHRAAKSRTRLKQQNTHSCSTRRLRVHSLLFLIAPNSTWAKLPKENSLILKGLMSNIGFVDDHWMGNKIGLISHTAKQSNKNFH